MDQGEPWDIAFCSPAMLASQDESACNIKIVSAVGHVPYPHLLADG